MTQYAESIADVEAFCGRFDEAIGVRFPERVDVVRIVAAASIESSHSRSPSATSRPSTCA